MTAPDGPPPTPAQQAADANLAASLFLKLFNGDEMWVDWGDPVNDYLLVDGLVRGITAEEFAYLERLAARSHQQGSTS